MHHLDLHHAQISVLSSLRHAESLRYSKLLDPLEMESDVFKFHIRKMIKHGLITKNSSGEYTLTAIGKEFANLLDENKGTYHKRPKLSVLMVIANKEQREPRYLFQKRRRQPFWDHWGFLSGRVLKGMSAESAATGELFKQTGLSATFETKGFLRQYDKDSNSTVIEDKLFQIMYAELPTNLPLIDYPHGENAWMTLNELLHQECHFEATEIVLKMLDSKSWFSEITTTLDISKF